MRVLIVEDVTLVAERISSLTKKYLDNCMVKISYNLADAQYCIAEEVYDLVLLDLNLNGADGFELLKLAVASSFQTIIITANIEKASTAFDYGVLDFISKPISESRFKVAIERFLHGNEQYRDKLKYLSIKSKGAVTLIDIDKVDFIKASGNYSEIYTADSKTYLHDKNLEKLLRVLPNDFIKVHRSYLIRKSQIARVLKHGGGKYDIELASGAILPLSRAIYKQLFMDSY